jgi:hypothetical protein
MTNPEIKINLNMVVPIDRPLQDHEVRIISSNIDRIQNSIAPINLEPETKEPTTRFQKMVSENRRIADAVSDINLRKIHLENDTIEIFSDQPKTVEWIEEEIRFLEALRKTLTTLQKLAP